MNNLIKTATDAALHAGEAILEIYKRDFKVELKADESPLTEADTAAHHIIVDALEDTHLPILSEESKMILYEERKAWTKYWLVDPLDGTKEFIKKNGEFTVNIALIEHGVPILGVVYVPVTATLYLGVTHGARGMEQGAWKAAECIGKTYDELLDSAFPISTSGFSRSTQSRKLRVVASKSHRSDKTYDFIASLEEVYGASEMVSCGSSLKLCMVAEGSADIYPRVAPTREWDTAAAQAVVKAAGGEVFQYDAELPVEAYSVQSAARTADTAAACSRPHAPGSMRYNKENLLNPYFVVSGLR